MWLPDEATASVRALLSAPNKDVIEALLSELGQVGAKTTDAQFHNCDARNHVFCTITCADQHMPRGMAPVFALLYPYDRQEHLLLVPGATLAEPDFPAFVAESARLNKSSAAAAAACAIDASRRLGAWAAALHKVQMSAPEAMSLVLGAFLDGALDCSQLRMAARQLSRRPQISAADAYVACLRQFSSTNYHKSMRRAARLTSVFSEHVLTMPPPGKLAEPSRGDDN